MCCGSTLGRVRGANITTSNAADHSIAQGRVGLNLILEHLSMFNKINMLYIAELCSMKQRHVERVAAQLVGFRRERGQCHTKLDATGDFSRDYHALAADGGGMTIQHATPEGRGAN